MSKNLVLKSLNTTEHLSFDQAFKANDLIMMFQPDCSACKAQVQNLGCFDSVKLLGTNGSEPRLKKEYSRFKSKYLAYSVSLKDLKDIDPNLNIVTPQYFKIKVDKANNLKLINLGYGLKDCATIQVKNSQL